MNRPSIQNAVVAAWVVATILVSVRGLALTSDLKQLYNSAERAFEQGDLDRSGPLFREVLLRTYLERGRLERAQGRAAQAVSDLEWAAKLNPGSAEVQAELGMAYVPDQQFGRAANALEKAAARGRPDAEVLSALGQAYFSLGKLPRAHSRLEGALALDPENRLTAYTLALVDLEQKSPADASRLFARLKQSVGDSARFRLLVGRAYEDTGYHAEGHRELRRALQLDPKIHFAHFLLGFAALQQGGSVRVDEAEREFKNEVTEHPDEFAPLYLLGVVLESKQRWAEARTYLEQAQKLAPDDPDVSFHLGAAALQAGDAAAAIESLGRSIALTRQSSHAQFQVGRAHYLLSRAYLQEGNREKGASEAKTASQLSGERAAWEEKNMSRLLQASVSKLRAIQPLITWQELSPPAAPDPDSEALETMYTRVLANSHNRLGVMAARLGRFEVAANQFERVSQLQPDFPKIDFNLGLAAFRAERLPEAMAALERLLARTPGEDDARELLGLAEFEHQDFSAALPNLEQARTAHPDDPDLLLALGTCLARRGQAEKAQEVFSKLLETQAESPELHVLLGRAAYAEGHTTDAVTEIRKALALDPRARRAHFYLGIIALDRGDLAGAQSEFQTEAENDPQDPKARYHLAYVLLEEQRRAEAIRLLKEILKQTPGYPEAHYSLGKTLVEEGQLSSGIAELETAVRLDPSKAYSHYQLGRAYLKLGKMQEARRELAHAQELKNRETPLGSRGNDRSE